MSREPGSITPTVKLNGLEMKRGEPAISIPLDQKPALATEQIIIFVACTIGEAKAFFNRLFFTLDVRKVNKQHMVYLPQRYHHPLPKVFYIQLTGGEHEFFGEGKILQVARHNAAIKFFRMSQSLQNYLRNLTQSAIYLLPSADAYEVLVDFYIMIRKQNSTQVKVGHEITIGTGPKKKIAKRNASEAMLLQLGYKASSST